MLAFLDFLVQSFEYILKTISENFICNEKQTNLPYMQYYVKASRYFLQKLNHLFVKCRKKWKRAGIRI